MTSVRLLFPLLLPVLLDAVAPPPPRRPNVVMVIFDDLRPVIGAYGDPLASTPYLDDFARKSHVFTRAYSQVGLSN